MATFQVGDPPDDPEVMHAEMRREQDDVRWIEDNMAALVKQYGIKFVKTYSGQRLREVY